MLHLSSNGYLGKKLYLCIKREYLRCSRLRIQCCHCSSLGHCSGEGLIPGPGTSTCLGHVLLRRMHNLLLWDGMFYKYPKAAEYTFISSIPGSFFRIDHISGHISSCSKFFKKWNYFKHFLRSQCCKTRNQLQEKKTTTKNTNSWKLNNTLLNKQWIIKEIKEEIKILRHKWQWRYDNPNLWDTQKQLWEGSS